MRTDPWAYLHYFHTLVQGDPKLLATGDISPHYSELSAQQFQHIGRLLEKGGFNVKVILLLRDPSEVFVPIRQQGVSGSIGQCF